MTDERENPDARRQTESIRALGTPSVWTDYYPEPFAMTEQRYRRLTSMPTAKYISETALTGSRQARRTARILLLIHLLLPFLIFGLCVVLSRR